MYKIAIVGASTLLGKELKDLLGESTLGAADVQLFDDAETQGQLDQVGDEITFVQTVGPDSFEHVDFTCFCGTPELTIKHWRAAVRAGSSVLDLTGAVDAEQGVVVAAPWLTAAPTDLCTPAVAPAHPSALALALVGDALKSVASVRMMAATVLVPASEFGRLAMDELHQQTINLLSFQSLPRPVYDAQVAYNLLTGLGENTTVKLNALEGRLRRHVAALLPTVPVQLQLVHAPVFHGCALSIAVELNKPVELAVLEEALGAEHLDLVLEDTDSPSNLAATGQDDVLVRLRADKDASGAIERLWIWMAADNLRLFAQNAIACMLELRKLRPPTTVQ